MKVIILAGGKGSRLWPISDKSLPKQFLNFGSEKSLVQKTIERFLRICPPSDLFIATQKEYEENLKKQIEEIEPLLSKNLILEPALKNTAPALLYSFAYLSAQGILDPDELVIVTPSDHLIDDEERFAEQLLELKGITLFGALPTRPETGYGYIEVENDRVKSFIEKPSLEKADLFFKSGKFLWNVGIVALSYSQFKNLIAKHCKPLAPYLNIDFKALSSSFLELPSISIDVAVLERAEDLKIVELKCHWSDVGCWDSIYEALAKDSNENAKIGNIVDINTKSSLIISGKRLISTVDIEDLIIVETEEVLLLAKKGSSQKIKQIEELLKRRDAKE
jgi:mannose-1-phosphate guanylyltransferase / mannose-6-phosphate isomerase